jgi:hypothetical protein
VQVVSALIDNDTTSAAVRREAAAVLCHAAAVGSSEQRMRMLRDGVLAPLCSLVRSRDPGMVADSLDAISRLITSADRAHPKKGSTSGMRFLSSRPNRDPHRETIRASIGGELKVRLAPRIFHGHMPAACDSALPPRAPRG